MLRSTLLGLLLPAALHAQPELRNAVTINNDFAFRLFQKAETADKNLCISPYSITSAFAMCYAGAAGKTETEFQTVFGFGANDDKTHGSFGALQKAVDARNRPGVQLGVANRLFQEQTFSVPQGFLKQVEKHYGAGVQLLDFKSQFEPSRLLINNWVEDKTKKRIKDLLPNGSINDKTVLVLVNTLYMKADWQTAFEKKETQPASFTLANGSKTTVAMMHTHNTFRYASDAHFQSVELPFKGDSLSMIFVLPVAQGPLETSRMHLSKNWYDKLQPAQTEVDLYLPKFKTECALALKKPLTAMGMRDAFTGFVADFSRLDPTKRTYISEAFHKTFVEVEESGAEAAAATAIVINEADSVSVARYVALRFDRPFFYIIRDRITNTILFIGEMEEPVKI